MSYQQVYADIQTYLVELSSLLRKRCKYVLANADCFGEVDIGMVDFLRISTLDPSHYFLAKSGLQLKIQN